jgi:hypothetical protein
MARGHVTVLLAAALVSLGAPLSGCGKQGLGEPCSVTNGNNDCDDAYICVSSGLLRDSSVDRCCPESTDQITDPRCLRSTTTGSGGAAGAGGTSEDAGDAASEDGESFGGSDGTAGTGGTTNTGGTAGTGGSGGSAGHDAGSHDASKG